MAGGSLQDLIAGEGGDASGGDAPLPSQVSAHMNPNEDPVMIDTPSKNHLGESLTEGEWKMSTSTEDLGGAVETSAKSTQIHDAAKLKMQVARAKAESAAKEANDLLAAAVDAVARVEPWSSEQEDALQAAVDAHGGRFAEKVNARQMAASMDWWSVSEMVPGKTKQQCSERWILNHSSQGEGDESDEQVPSVLLTAASEAAASAAGVLLAAAAAAEEEQRVRQEGVRQSTPIEVRKETMETGSGDPDNLMEYNALVFDALHAKRDSVQKLQAKVRGLQLDIRQLHKDKAEQEAENCAAVKHWGEKMAAKDQALVEMTMGRDQLQQDVDRQIGEVRAASKEQLDALRDQLHETRTRLEGEVEHLSEQLMKVRTFRANMEKVEAEVVHLKTQLKDMKAEQKAKQEAAEKDMYEENIRCNKIVAGARMAGVNTDAMEEALKQRVQKMDKQGNRVGLSQLEALVTLLADTMRNGSMGQRQRPAEAPVEAEESRPGEELQLPQVPSGSRGGAGPPKHRGRRAGARTKEEKAVEFPLVPMPTSSRTSKVRVQCKYMYSAGGLRLSSRQ
jgi:hypothetical protein